ncbi:MAG: hypothetical protein IPG76_11290 [Acidobacteria bacterium]|nr:hypothetical protein [Acidobacteriota bacterium]
MTEMKRMVAQAMEQGALGLSSSLQYMPDRFATTDELVELAKVAAQFGGIYITHQRSESGKIFESLDEIFCHRRARENSGGNLPSEDGLQGQLGQNGRSVEADS